MPNLKFSNEVIDYIAKNIFTNVRDLESAFITLAGYSDLVGVELTVELAKEKLKERFTEKEKNNYSLDEIVSAVSEYYHISTSDIKSKKRSRGIVVTRQVCIHIINRLTDCSSTEIGSYFNKDHSTVLHSLKMIENLFKTDPTLESTIEKIIKKIQKK